MPQYFRFAQMFGFPLKQNSQLTMASVSIGVSYLLSSFMGLNSRHACKARLDSNSLSNEPIFDILANFFDDARGLVSEDQLFGYFVRLVIVAIAAADTGTDDFDQNIGIPDWLNWSLLNFHLALANPDTGSV